MYSEVDISARNPVAYITPFGLKVEIVGPDFIGFWYETGNQCSGVSMLCEFCAELHFTVVYCLVPH
jgi:hypothetical protein